MADDNRFYVKSLTLENFRCFEKTDLGPFDPHFNLLVGENGTGKSSALLALASLMQSIAGFGSLDLGPSFRMSDVRADNDKTNLFGPKALFARAEANWFGTKFEPSQTLRPPHGLPEFDQSSGVRERIASTYPVLLRFTTERRFNSHASAEAVKFDRSSPVRSDAFDNWYDAGASGDELQAWFKDVTLAALQSAGGLEAPTLKLVEGACVSTIQGAAQVRYLQARRDIVIDFSDGKSLSFGSMSDGQRALVGLVAEIVRRACILNFDLLGADTLLQTPGLVLIDEIDLHLHPKWQRNIVSALKRIFPKIQFFATTHSPQVIGEAKPEEIVLLTKDGKQNRPMGSYGMDSNWILECVMEAEGRDPEIARRIKAIFDDIEEDRFDEAKAEIAKLRSEIGDAPDLAGAEAYIWRIEHGVDEAAE